MLDAMFSVIRLLWVCFVAADLLIRSVSSSLSQAEIERVRNFYCGSYTICTSCVSAETEEFPCDWCVANNKCSYDPVENCLGDIFVSGINRKGGSYRRGPGNCSHISVKAGSSELLVPYSTTLKRIHVQVENVAQQNIVQPTFSCRFTIEGRSISVTSHLWKKTLSCAPIVFMYNSTAPNIIVPFEVVVVGGAGHTNRNLDNPSNFHILVYRCSVMADDCSKCLVVDSKYKCGWYQNTNRCEVQNNWDNAKGVWLSHGQSCPEITTLPPTSEPWDGVNNVTIDGVNPYYYDDEDEVTESITEVITASGTEVIIELITEAATESGEESIQESITEFPFTTICLTLTTAAVIIVFAILSIAAMAWRRKSKQNSRVVRNLQEKIVQFELQVGEPTYSDYDYPRY